MRNDPPVPTPWKNTVEASQRARCGLKLVYRAIKRGDLRAARLGGRRGAIRIHESWIDEWIARNATPIEVHR
jgi:excisionase family DNA binding protein